MTNLWVNRLIGDHQPGTRKIAFTSFDPYKADSTLLEPGLLGPATLQCRHPALSISYTQ